MVVLSGWRPLYILTAVYFLLAGAYAVRNAAWQAPDEPAHYRYVAQLAEGRFPRMEPGDYDQAAQAAAVSARFPPDLPLDRGFAYEDYQPPLYYLLLTPVFWLSGGSLTALRLASAVLGAGVVVLAFGLGRLLFPGRPWLALTPAVLVALLPQHVALLASVNNDALAELLVAALLYVSLRWGVGRSAPADRVLGVLLGLAFLTKVTAYLFAGVLGVVLFWQWLEAGWRALPWRPAARIFVPAVLIGALWWVRNALVYPGPDWLGIQAHDAVVVGQPTTAEWIAVYGAGPLVARFGQTTFRSFWGQFGWMAAPLPDWVYPPLLLFVALAGAGLAPVWQRRRTWSADRRRQLLILAALLGLNLALYLTYNARYVQHQGRYLFVSLIPIGVGLAVGAATWLQPLGRRIPAAYWLLPLGLAAGLLGLNWLALTRILPCLYYNAAC